MVQIRKLVKSFAPRCHWNVDTWKSLSTQYRRDKVALRTTCIKTVRFKIIKTSTGCQYVGYLYYSENLKWAAQNLRLGRGLDMAGLNTI